MPTLYFFMETLLLMASRYMPGVKGKVASIICEKRVRLTLPCPAPNFAFDVPTRRPLPTRRRSAPGDCPADRKHFVGCRTSNTARCDRFGQNVHDRERHPKRGQAHTGHFAQQNAGCAALRR